jgi:hypothetical protein
MCIGTEPDMPSTMRKIVGCATPGDMKSTIVTEPPAVVCSVSSTSVSPV